jgi:hypothetical protein
MSQKEVPLFVDRSERLLAPDQGRSNERFRRKAGKFTLANLVAGVYRPPARRTSNFRVLSGVKLLRLILSMGLGYALAYTSRFERTFVAVAAAGKASFAVLARHGKVWRGSVTFVPGRAP